jgi:hypothetical protein
VSAYWISYDLDKPGQDYRDLIAALEGLGAKRIMYSDWLVNSNYTAEQLRNHLTQFMDGNDRILVAGLNGVAAWQRLMISHDTVKQILAA